MCLRNSVITVLLSGWDGQIPPEGDGAVVYANTATDRTDCLSFGVSSAAGGLVQFKVSDFGFEVVFCPISRFFQLFSRVIDVAATPPVRGEEF